MDDLNKVSKVVKYILENHKQARNSDSYLYLKVLEHYAGKQGIDIRDISIKSFPIFESVRRSRQKIQAKYPELAASNRVHRFRKQNEETFREFAKSGA